uniref:Uncharacterized protein n=1 Tax=Candidatus Kentrum eta TaxID=2126337 RepID=A0A450VAI3_9GAMM|nr:MAG: hypothetical protein BECKH772A_GA0070896_102414 [Candidatus Kentron sp. H]VFK02039.1 MAG: hypothetical protein BECKH772B_GA0070898_102574 [Candidatus Kentron sp. H]VFK05121.1 MAG: hypothetical protein BECKH772C_GA0070978_102384 [Candidatus Kentron sp. H]
MNRLDTKTQKLILNLLVEGNSLRATARIADVSRTTVDKLLNDAGKACLEFQDRTLRNLPSKNVQCDEIWSFVYSKDKNVPEDKRGEFGYGDVWTWTAIDSQTKLVPCWPRGYQRRKRGKAVYFGFGGPFGQSGTANHRWPQAVY